MDQVKTAFAKASELIRAGDLPMAEAVCRESLQRHPDEHNLSCLLGAVLIRLRRPGEAEDTLRRVTERVPNFARAHDELANAMLAQNQPERAIPSLERTIELDPDNRLARYKLGEIRAALGQQTAADDSLAETEKALMDAALLRAQGQFQGAEELYNSILEHDPDNSKVFYLLGTLAIEQQQYSDAAVFLRRACTLAPDDANAWVDLGSAYAEQERFGDAEAAVRRAIQLQRESPRARQVLAGVLSREGRYDEAATVLAKALELLPDNVELLLANGHSLRTVGRHDDAISAYRRALELAPSSGDAWWSLANMKTHDFSAADRDVMREQLEREDLDEQARVGMSFAAGKAAEDAGDFSAAFDLFIAGNRLRRGRESYDPVATTQRVDDLIDAFGASSFDSDTSASPDDTAPVFIIGMPRSGTTLVEQILASHSQVAGTRELPYIDQLAQRMPGEGEGAASTGQYAQWYLDKTSAHRGSEPLFTDKAPGNFWHVGLIARILPQARFINVRRHPLDACMGSFKQLFAVGQPWSYDFFEIAEYCLDYHRLMGHWHEVLPGRILDVNYEDVIANIEGEVRRILEHCGLEFEEACVAFHETERAIESASSEQVRMPLYDTAVNHWRNYEAQLGEIIEILQPLVAAERSQK